MANLNKVFLIGRLTADPELRYTPNGTPVTDLRLAANRTFQGRDGESKEETLFIDVTVWNRQAENCCQFLRKGRQVHIEGFLRTESWDDKNTGEKRSKVKVQADNVQFLDRRDDAGGGGGEDGDYQPAGRGEARRPSPGYSNGPSRGHGGGPSGGGSAPPQQARRQAPPPPADDDMPDDDIPF